MNKNNYVDNFIYTQYVQVPHYISCEYRNVKYQKYPDDFLTWDLVAKCYFVSTSIDFWCKIPCYVQLWRENYRGRIFFQSKRLLCAQSRHQLCRSL